MDYSEFPLLDLKKKEDRSCPNSGLMTRTGQRTPPTVCCWDSASPHTLRSCFGERLSLARQSANFSLFAVAQARETVHKRFALYILNEGGYRDGKL